MNSKIILLGILLLTFTNSGFSGDKLLRTEKVQNTKDEWRQLFNGKDLTGWKHVGQGSMSVEDGLIRGHGG